MFGSLSLLFEFCIFLITVYFYFYTQGVYILSYAKRVFAYPVNIFLPLIIGAVIFTAESYILSWLHITFLIFPIALSILFLSYKKKLLSFIKIPTEHRKASALTLVLAIIFSLQMILNGNIGNSIYFFGDDLAHLAYINELRFAFPPQHPGFAGIPLQGYHFFYDFLIATISNASFLSPYSLYFHFMPLFVALGWAFGTYSLIFSWTGKISAALWGVFFVLFGSSFDYILIFVKNSIFFPGTNFGIDQPVGALFNAPYAFSVVIILATLLLMQNYLKKRNNILLILISVFVGITPMFKIYAGIISIAGFCVFVVFELIRKNWSVLYSCILAGGVILATFYVFVGVGAGLFYFPLWPIERIMNQIFPNYDYKEKIDTYSRYRVIHGLISTHLTTLSIFLIGNLGTRFIGILLSPLIVLRNKKMPSVFSCILLSMMLVSVIVPLFFAQTIKPFEMIQMAWYYPFFGALFAALGFSFFFSLKFSKSVKTFILIVIIIATIPVESIIIYKKIASLLTVERTLFPDNSMRWLRNNGSYSDTVLYLPLNKSYTNKEALTNWFYRSSPYIAAFGNKRMYLGYQYTVAPNMPVDDRLEFVASINKIEYAEKSDNQMINKIIGDIKNRKIAYIYTNFPLKIFKNNSSVPIVFKDTSAVIYRVE